MNSDTKIKNFASKISKHLTVSDYKGLSSKDGVFNSLKGYGYPIKEGEVTDENWEELYNLLTVEEKFFSRPDVKNKLTPFKNLIAMLENGLAEGNIRMHDLLLNEIEECKNSIKYLSGNNE